ncbi:MAG: radical SAM protein [Deltaproteobacteria bacterium]|nr:radical SAM protein [Deltaproteobacteria bacterium]
MNRIIFVNPPFTVWGSGAPLPKTLENTTPSFGLCCLAAVVRQKGYTPFIVEAGALQLTLDEAFERIIALRPDVVGFRASTISFNNAAQLAGRIKEFDKKIITLIGGPHVTAIPTETFEKFPQFDVGVIGEGEETIVELLGVLDGFGMDEPRLESIAGIVFRRAAGVHITAKRPYIKDLDDLPMPAWDLLEGFPGRYQPPLMSYKSLPVASMVTSRGCPFQCAFCDRSVFGNRYRGYSAEYVSAMIERLVERYGVKHLLFYDDLFAASEKRLTSICERMMERKLNVSWSCDARVNTVTPQTLSLMKKAGCWEIAYGIESGSQEILDLIGKDIKIHEIEAGVRRTHEAGIKVKGLFMMGHPGETRETIKETVELAVRLPFDHINISKVTPFPGTELFKTAHKYGKFNADWALMNALQFVFVPHGFTEKELEREYKNALKRFYWRPKKTLELLGALLGDRAGMARLLKANNVFLKTAALNIFKKKDRLKKPAGV